ncbi:MAG: hypothetical protein ACC631_04145 [Halocynthiibacter sp.]
MAHILPTVSHDRILLKMSFRTRLDSQPTLKLDGRKLVGQMTDTNRYFWSFDAPGLQPATTYELELIEEGGRRLCDPWILKTFPALNANPQKFRLMVYTCAGGHQDARLPGGGPVFLPLADRIRLLRRGLAFKPQGIVANGDHVYWDLRAGKSVAFLGGSAIAKRLDATSFDRALPVLGTRNEGKLKRIVNPQISELYGTMLRSTPVWFLLDDHDYFENDHADDQIITFPPDPFMLRLARATQHLYYPEFLPDPNRPAGLPGAGRGDRPAGVAESYGTMRFGKLVELLLYDCRRFMTLKGPSAVFVAGEAERWLMARMAANDTRHFVQVPSTPMGWSAGKWAEWYPDVLQEDGQLGTATAKPYWQEGWLRQHDRILEAASAMKRLPLFISGDLHAIAEGRIRRSGDLDLHDNPIITALAGPLGTGPPGWPSAFRGTGALPPSSLDIEQGLPPLEKNGFTLIDFSADLVTFRFFSWKPDEPAEAIDTLEPFHTVEYRLKT